MDHEAGGIGRQVRYWRLRRNLDRRHLADMVGRSVSWLDKIERGERNLLRLPMLERVAEALSVDPSVLIDGPAARRAADCADATEVAAIRAALGQYPSVSPQSVDQPLVTLARFTRQLTFVEHAWLSSHLSVVGQHLPGLLGDAQVLVLTSRADGQVAAGRALVIAYRLASSMLLKFETNDVAWLAADRAMHAALGLHDTLALARATRSVARAMTSTGQRADAIAALTGMADRMRPELAEHEHELLSPYGMLFLAASIAAAGQEDAALALAMHEQAEAASRRIDPRHETHHTTFGLSNVAIHRVAALVRLHEAGRALEYAESVDPGAIAALPPERKANYLLDMTEAYADVGRHVDAVRTLCDAEQAAPEEVRCRPVAHGLLRLLMNKTNGESGRTIRQLAGRSGVTA